VTGQPLAKAVAAEHGTARQKLVDAASQAGSNSDDQTALKLYKEALSTTPKGPDTDDANILSCMSQSYLALRQYSDSIKVLDQAIALRKNPTTKEMKKSLAWFYYQKSKPEIALRQWDRAIADLTTTIELDPLDAGYPSSRGKLYAKVGRNNDAVNDLTKSLALSEAEMSGKLTKRYAFKTRAGRIETLYERAKAYKSLGKMKEYNQDFAEANKLTDSL